MGPSLFETSNQLWVFLFTIYGGALLGLLYSVLTIVRETVAGRRRAVRGAATVLFDILFWLLATAAAFALLWYTSEGAFHYYDVAGFGIGAALWCLGPGRAIRSLHERIVRALRAAWGRIRETSLFKLLNR